MTDDELMLRAVALALQTVGITSPNPPVGAVLFRDGNVVGEGATQPAGQAHAEVVALQAAGERARGATLYVTLEPCSHYGRTAPCADALVSAGITEAHIAVLDPNPLVNGGGATRLQDGGVAIVMGPTPPETLELIQPHTTYFTLGRPHVTVAVDGPSESRWRLEAASDAVWSDRGLFRRNGLRVPFESPRAGGYEESLRGLAVGGMRSLLVESERVANDLGAAGLVDKIVAPHSP